jgi:2-polyprenyl-3-methyl-5-hydroxy-6-metoxy-1,4-benzoquinol methylase
MDTEGRMLVMSADEVQKGNQRWWTNNPMTYDWHRDNKLQRYSEPWFDVVDQRFIHAARLFATDRRPFDRVLPLDDLPGKRVLEIGCGMGLHTEIMVRAGAAVTAVDLSPASVEGTQKRLSMKGLSAMVLQADAEDLPFGVREFDFVWSWGVIHHSARTAKIVREIARVVRPDGHVRVMVYNRLGMGARQAFWRHHVLRLGFLRRSFEETLYRVTDGFSARYYVPEQFEDLFRAYFRDVSSEVCGQEADALPLPRRLRHWVVRIVPEGYLRKAQQRRGSFIFLKAGNLL